jgi:toxin ParE1/3/4
VTFFKVIFTRLAERHLDDLHAYITKNANEERADDYVGRIIECCKSLAPFPQRGTGRDDILPGLRVIGFERRITIAFFVTADTVLIEGIFYGGQDLGAKLRSRIISAPAARSRP